MIDVANSSLINVVDPDPGLYQLSKAMWIWCDNGDPQKAIKMNRGSILGNVNDVICRKVENVVLRTYPNAKMVHVERPMLPWDD